MRSISDSERRILDRLLSIDFEGAAALRLQVDHLTGVEPNCTCGCPSITPHIKRQKAPHASGSRLLPVEIQELVRTNGIERTVICFLDDDGYLANLECVYYDDAVSEWPNVEDCAVLMRDAEGHLVSAVLPNGAQVRPQEENDRWVSFEPAGGGFNASTWSGWRESFDATGQRVSRVFTK